MTLLEMIAECDEDDRQRQNAVKEALCTQFGVEMDFGANYEHLRMIVPEKFEKLNDPFVKQLLKWDWVFTDPNAEDKVILLHTDAWEISPLRKL